MTHHRNFYFEKVSSRTTLGGNTPPGPHYAHEQRDSNFTTDDVESSIVPRGGRFITERQPADPSSARYCEVFCRSRLSSHAPIPNLPDYAGGESHRQLFPGDEKELGAICFIIGCALISALFVFAILFFYMALIG